MKQIKDTRMFRWVFEAQTETTAAAKEIWDIWSDIKGWRDWNQHIEWSDIEGPFGFGTKGSLKVKGFSKTDFLLTDVIPHEKFGICAHLLLTTISLTHRIYPGENGMTTLSQRAEISGLLTPFLKWKLASMFKEEMPEALRKLNALAGQ